MRRVPQSVALLPVLLPALALAAAHPWSDYDDTQGIWLKGTIRSTSYDRPHQVIQLEVPGAQPHMWTVILASPSKMASRGLQVSALVPGLTVKVYVYPAIDVPDEARALRISIGGNVTELW